MIQYIKTSNLMAAKIAAQPRCSVSIRERMADDIREMGFAGENVTPATLKQRGWPEAVTRKHGDKAVRLAQRLSVRQTVEG